MTTKDIHENHEPATPLGLGLSEGLGPLPATSYTLASGGSFTWVRGWDEKQMLAFAAQAVAAERDRCRAVCRQYGRTLHAMGSSREAEACFVLGRDL